MKLNHFIDLISDCERRDLTMNAIAYDRIEAVLIDPFGGREDIKNQVIRAVDPVTFAEDPLRVVRAIRFGTRYQGFTIEPGTADVMRRLVYDRELNHLSDERFVAELQKVYSDHWNDAARILHFWDMLVVFGCMQHVDFFAQIGDVDGAIKLHEYLPRLLGAVVELDSNMVLMCTLALLGVSCEDGPERNFAPLKKFWPDVYTLVRSQIFLRVEAIQHMDVDDFAGFTRVVAGELMRLRLHSADTMKFAKFMDAVGVAGDTTTPTLHQDICTAWQTINASMFPGLEGRELGNAIKEARITMFVSDFMG